MHLTIHSLFPYTLCFHRSWSNYGANEIMNVKMEILSCSFSLVILDVNFFCTVNAETDSATIGKNIHRHSLEYTPNGSNPSELPESQNKSSYQFAGLSWFEPHEGTCLKMYLFFCIIASKTVRSVL